MTIEEFTGIIDLYGAESARWPKALRAECESFIANNAAARKLLDQEWVVDDLMGQLEVPGFPGLESRVLNQPLPEPKGSIFEELANWLLPGESFGKQFWRPAIVACIPLAFGIVVANYFSFGVYIESDGFQYWGDELAMLLLTDYTETRF
ncbi:MAG: hypothetical protein P8N94_00630 [Gammaproteobacteria bacterium]|nr:hypothetical protein [Gammaproteobacteria bacterium]MDG2336482.1 hypothetical protein [Gammaproteobacteria bacterium]